MDTQNIKGIKKAIEGLYLEYKPKGKVIYKGDTEEINQYSQKEMVKKFVNIPNRLIQ